VRPGKNRQMVSEKDIRISINKKKLNLSGESADTE
jgi:hypothetical protein